MPTNVFTLDLAAVQYSTAAAEVQAWIGYNGLLANYGGSGQIAGITRDGDFTKAARVGHGEIEFPFSNEGDAKTQLLHQKYWQLAANFRSQPLGTPAQDRADLLLIDEADFHDEGGGIISWTRSYANIPVPRDVFEDHSYGFQHFTRSGSALKLNELAFDVISRVRYEYFHVRDLGNWPVVLAPRFVALTDTIFRKRGKGNLSLSEGFVISSDPQILAEDTKLRLWKYPIMERRSRFIAGPTVEFWGDAFNVSVA